MTPRPSWRRKVAGIGLLVLAFIGTFLPILQGGVFLVLGLFVLRDQYRWAHRGMEWTRTRWPGPAAKVEAMEARLIAWGNRQGERLRRLIPGAG
jgi:hypothetical protein